MASTYDALRRLRPNARFLLTQDGTHNNEPYLSLWEDAAPPPSDQEIADTIAVLEAEQAAAAQQAAAAVAADTTERDAIVQAQTVFQTYIDTPPASITGALNAVTIKWLCRFALWMIRRELRRTF